MFYRNGSYYIVCLISSLLFSSSLLARAGAGRGAALLCSVPVLRRALWPATYAVPIYAVPFLSCQHAALSAFNARRRRLRTGDRALWRDAALPREYPPVTVTDLGRAGMAVAAGVGQKHHITAGDFFCVLV